MEAEPEPQGVLPAAKEALLAQLVGIFDSDDGHTDAAIDRALQVFRSATDELRVDLEVVDRVKTALCQSLALGHVSARCLHAAIESLTPPSPDSLGLTDSSDSDAEEEAAPSEKLRFYRTMPPQLQTDRSVFVKVLWNTGLHALALLREASEVVQSDHRVLLAVLEELAPLSGSEALRKALLALLRGDSDDHLAMQMPLDERFLSMVITELAPFSGRDSSTLVSNAELFDLAKDMYQTKLDACEESVNYAEFFADREAYAYITVTREQHFVAMAEFIFKDLSEVGAARVVKSVVGDSVLSRRGAAERCCALLAELIDEPQKATGLGLCPVDCAVLERSTIADLVNLEVMEAKKQIDGVFRSITGAETAALGGPVSVKDEESLTLQSVRTMIDWEAAVLCTPMTDAERDQHADSSGWPLEQAWTRLCAYIGTGELRLTKSDLWEVSPSIRSERGPVALAAPIEVDAEILLRAILAVGDPNSDSEEDAAGDSEGHTAPGPPGAGGNIPEGVPHESAKDEPIDAFESALMRVRNPRPAYKRLAFAKLLHPTLAQRVLIEDLDLAGEIMAHFSRTCGPGMHPKLEQFVHHIESHGCELPEMPLTVLSWLWVTGGVGAEPGLPDFSVWLELDRAAVLSFPASVYSMVESIGFSRIEIQAAQLSLNPDASISGLLSKVGLSGHMDSEQLVESLVDAVPRGGEATAEDHEMLAALTSSSELSKLAGIMISLRKLSLDPQSTWLRSKFADDASMLEVKDRIQRELLNDEEYDDERLAPLAEAGVADLLLDVGVGFFPVAVDLGNRCLENSRVRAQVTGFTLDVFSNLHNQKLRSLGMPPPVWEDILPVVKLATSVFAHAMILLNQASDVLRSLDGESLTRVTTLLAGAKFCSCAEIQAIAFDDDKLATLAGVGLHVADRFAVRKMVSDFLSSSGDAEMQNDCGAGQLGFALQCADWWAIEKFGLVTPAACQQVLGRNCILPLQRAITHGAPTALVKRISAAYPEAHATLIGDDGHHIMDNHARHCQFCPSPSEFNAERCDMHMPSEELCPEATRRFLLEAAGPDYQRGLNKLEDSMRVRLGGIPKAPHPNDVTELPDGSVVPSLDLWEARYGDSHVGEAATLEALPEDDDLPDMTRFESEVQQLCAMGFDADAALMVLTEVSQLGVAPAEMLNEAIARLVS